MAFEMAACYQRHRKGISMQITVTSNSFFAQWLSVIQVSGQYNSQLFFSKVVYCLAEKYIILTRWKSSAFHKVVF